MLISPNPVLTVCEEGAIHHMSKTPPLFRLSFEPTDRELPLHSGISASSVDFLPIGFKPSEKDIICGRARENFHHDGNRYFRDLIQQNVGPYLAARTKVEKTEAIAAIVDKICQDSPNGGFIKRDSRTGRWYRIKDNEARDKVGHAIRKAVQRLEETKPKLAARIRKEHTQSASSSSSSVTKQKGSTIYGDLAIIGKNLRKDASSCQKSGEDEKIPANRRAPTIRDEQHHDDNHRAVPFTSAYDSVSNVAGVQAVHTHETSMPTQSNVLERLLGHNVNGFPVAPHRQALNSSRAPIGGMAALTDYLSVGNVSAFPTSTGMATVDSARLVASLWTQPGLFQRSTTTTLPHSFMQQIGLRSSPVATEKLWLTAAALRHQHEVQTANELEYARRLAYTALQDMSHANVSTSGGASRQTRQHSKDETDSE